MNNYQLNVGSDLKIKSLEKTHKHFLNKSAILFGASGSGKSTILIEILYLLSPYVPIIFVFSPTAEDNNAFEGIVPNCLIFKTVDLKQLEAIYMRQKAATKIYNTVNNIDSLRELFSKIATHNDIECVKLAYINANKIIKRKELDLSLSVSEKKIAVKEIKSIRDIYLISVYKSVIHSNKKRLKRLDLTDSEKYIIIYLYFNPNCVVVFDDCGAELKRFQKEVVYKQIMYQGRHSYINSILTLQDDTGLDSGVKKNAFVNIFTTAQCAMAYFEKKSSSFTKKDKIVASRIISYIYAEEPIKTYRKFVYLRDDPNPFRFTIADTYENFKFGCKKLWELCNKVEGTHNVCDFSSDPLMEAFKIDI
jgi:ABC-type cobalamin/Fe3+-siderophores transport system ATPase subunit